MVRYAIDHGVNYLDTAWPYHKSNSEKFVGKVLQDGYREKVKIATKLPSWEIEKQSDMDKYLDKQLKKLQTDKIDFYLLHALNEEHWDNYQELDVFEWIEKVRDENKIDHIGFSFHDDLGTFKEIVDSYDWDFCQIQYNYLDQDLQAGKEGLKHAADQGLGVIIMEPLRGGQLAEVPDVIDRIWNRADIDRSPVEWALIWLWNQPEVSLVLSGMSAMNHVRENVEIADRSGVGILSDEEEEIIEEARKKFKEVAPVNCTGCNYCMPCPNGVNIPQNFDLYNRAEIYGEYEGRKKDYYNNMDEDARASACIACGQCEEVCPQSLQIIELMEGVAEYFEER